MQAWWKDARVVPGDWSFEAEDEDEHVGEVYVRAPFARAHKWVMRHMKQKMLQIQNVNPYK